MEDKVFERILAEKPAPDINILAEMVNAGLAIPCGTKKVYNNLAFSALGEIIKRVSGREHDRYMQENIFSPLGMKDTSFYHDGMDTRRVIPTVNPFEINVESFYKGKYPAGALFSTAPDLMVFGQTLLNSGSHKGHALLSPLTLRSMTAPQTEGIEPYDKVDFNGVETGLGWLLPLQSHSIIHRDIYGHHGAGNSMLWIYPKEELCLVFLSNYAGAAEKGFQWDYILNVFSTCIDKSFC
jgi:CubicO group peptidase (beta-lactamase class C family)